MPYITDSERKRLDDLMDEQGLDGFTVGTSGQLNYVITKLIHNYLILKGLSYSNINEVIGVLECAKLELYRMIAAPYEDDKRSQNGWISKLDSKV